MKKLLVILGFFAVMMGFAVWEIVATTKFYRTTLDLLGELENSFTVYEDRLDSAENIASLEKLEAHWESGRKLVLMFGNHTVVRNAEERITALGEYTRQNEFSDAMVSLRQTERYVSDLLQDVYPCATNLF